jgi:predicted DNA-binding transcriptional regulator AlpA
MREQQAQRQNVKPLSEAITSVYPSIDTARQDRQRQPDEVASLPFALIHFDRLPDSARVPISVVEAVTGWSRSTVWRRAKDGTIPKPVHESPGCARWVVGHLRAKLAK